MKENIVKVILGVVAGVLVIALAIEAVLWNNDKKAYKVQIDQIQSELEEYKKTADELATYKEEAEAYKEEIETYKVEIDRLKELEEAYIELSSLEAEEVESSDSATLQAEEAKEEVVEVPTPAPTPAPIPAPAPNFIDENNTVTSGKYAGIVIDTTPSYEGGEW